MALRLLPFRQYNEHDVVNMFAFDPAVALDSTTDDGQASQGSLVKISNGNFNEDVITYGSDSYLGKTDYPFVGGDMYPTVNLKITGCGANETKGAVLGVTLNQTAKNDENGEKLLYNATKKEELQAVLPGQAVPVATNGWFTFVAAAVETGEEPVAGGKVYLKAGANATTPATLSNTDNTGANPLVGTCLAVGAGAKTGKEEVYVVKLKL